MKTKLTLSIDSAKVKRVKAFGRKRKKSVSELVEEMIDKLTTDTPPARTWSQRWGGTLGLTTADMKRDDRFGKLVRRATAAPRTRKKQRRLMRIFLDSDVIIAALDGNELQSSDAQRVMDLVEAGSVQAVTTPVVLANVMHVVSQKWRISRTRVDRPRVVGDC